MVPDRVTVPAVLIVTGTVHPEVGNPSDQVPVPFITRVAPPVALNVPDVDLARPPLLYNMKAPDSTVLLVCIAQPPTFKSASKVIVPDCVVIPPVHIMVGQLNLYPVLNMERVPAKVPEVCSKVPLAAQRKPLAENVIVPAVLMVTLRPIVEVDACDQFPVPVSV